jgi:hypothetical protein
LNAVGFSLSMQGERGARAHITWLKCITARKRNYAYSNATIDPTAEGFKH